MSAPRIQFATATAEVVPFPSRPAALTRPGLNPSDLSVRVTHRGRVGMFDTPEELLNTLAEVAANARRARRRAAVAAMFQPARRMAVTLAGQLGKARS